MMKRKSLWVSLYMILLVLCVGCKQEQVIENSGQTIYFFDKLKNDLVEELLPADFALLQTEQEQVEYIISQLKQNKSSLLTPSQMGPEMPIESGTTSIDPTNRIVHIHFTQSYNDLSPQEKIGMRSSIVYSLTQLGYVDGVSFYVEQMPLTLANGRAVETIKIENINRGDLNPNPTTKNVVLKVYFANKEGKLEKEEHSFAVSNSSKKENLIIDELIRGPKEDDLQPTVPSDLVINKIEPINGVCQISLSFDTKSSFFKTDEDRKLMIYSIVNSLTELTHIKKVSILIDGQAQVPFTEDISFPSTFERSEAYISEEKSTS